MASSPATILMRMRIARRQAARKLARENGEPVDDGPQDVWDDTQEINISSNLPSTNAT